MPLSNCPRCDAALMGTEKACPKCGRPLASSGTLATAPGKATLCPICKLPIYAATISGNALLHCAECQGLVMGREGLMKLQPHGPKQIDISAEERDYRRPQFFEPRKKPPFLICPLCSKRMAETKLGSLAVDLCEACNALWLDGPKVKSFNDVLGPYKWRMSKTAKPGESRLQKIKKSWDEE